MLARSAGHHWGVVLEAPDAAALARFYGDLLGWEVTYGDGGGASLAPAGSVAYLAIQPAAAYVRPVWPARAGEQQITSHLDIEVPDLAVAVEEALAVGAVLADFQPQENVRVMLDPAGHPFCLYVDS
jgi:catechol 2,3-dioxygenase-like lactoylglutathione lyase family enzyme